MALKEGDFILTKDGKILEVLRTEEVEGVLYVQGRLPAKGHLPVREIWLEAKEIDKVLSQKEMFDAFTRREHEALLAVLKIINLLSS